MNGSTDKAIVKQETIYISLLHGGVQKLRYLSVENVNLQTLRIAFERIGINNFKDSIVGLIVDRTRVNTGRKR